MGAAEGSLPSPGLSPLFCWGEQSLCPPEGVLVLGPPAKSGFGGPALGPHAQRY